MPTETAARTDSADDLAAEVWESPDGSFGLSIEPKEAHIYFLIWGEASLPMARNVTAAVFAACERHRCSKVLCDMRNVRGRFGTFDTLDLVSDYRKVIGLAPILSAVLKAPDAIADNDFYEAIAGNREWQTKVFSDREEALRWLSGPAAYTTEP